MSEILDYENPDFVVHTGDVVSGFAWDKKTRPWLATVWD
jgi:predicted phosphodiesterase